MAPPSTAANKPRTINDYKVALLKLRVGLPPKDAKLEEYESKGRKTCLILLMLFTLVATIVGCIYPEAIVFSFCPREWVDDSRI